MSQRSRRQRAHLESTSALSATGFLMPNVEVTGLQRPERKDDEHTDLAGR